MNNKDNPREELEIWEKRRINYTIIRDVWKMVQDRKYNEDISAEKKKCKIENLWKRLGLSKEQFYNIISATYSRNIKLKTIAERLQKETHIDKQYFLGEKIFKIDEILEKDWVEYFEYRWCLAKIIDEWKKANNKEDILEKYKCKLNKKGVCHNKAKCKLDQDLQIKLEKYVKGIKEFEYRYNTKLRNIEGYRLGDISTNYIAQDVYRLFYWIRVGEPCPDRKISAKVNEISNSMSSINLEELGDLKDSEITEYKEVLVRQLEMLEVIRGLKKYRNNIS